MSSESLAAQFGRILTKNPECDGFSDAQVEEFLKLYDQVTSNSKARTSICQHNFGDQEEELICIARHVECPSEVSWVKIDCYTHRPYFKAMQVPSSVKEDKEQLETLLECSKSIARTLDGE